MTIALDIIENIHDGTVRIPASQFIHQLETVRNGAHREATEHFERTYKRYLEKKQEKAEAGV